MSIAMMAQREARVIPQGWQHPRDASGHYVGLLSDWAGHLQSMAEHPDWYDDDEPTFTRSEFMPDAGEGETEIAAYETVSEGTPISPPFPNTPEGRLALLRYCADNCQIIRQSFGIEAWAAILWGSALIDIHTGELTASGPPA